MSTFTTSTYSPSSTRGYIISPCPPSQSVCRLWECNATLRVINNPTHGRFFFGLSTVSILALISTDSLSIYLQDCFFSVRRNAGWLHGVGGWTDEYICGCSQPASQPGNLSVFFCFVFTRHLHGIYTLTLHFFAFYDGLLRSPDHSDHSMQLQGLRRLHM